MWMFQEEQQVLAGEEQAFEALVARYGSFVFQRIVTDLKDYDTSCDVLQHVLIQLYRSLPALDRDLLSQVLAGAGDPTQNSR